ncbi:MAG: antibiotic biosynthesis monooxygenase [Ferruginibacter sp.]|nr:antibiotic biosynthesis monooxygenase [Ferruginibacter sp.]
MSTVGNHIEIIRFKVKPTIANDFVAARERVDEEVRQIDGFLGSELCRLNEETWVIFIRWENAVKTKAAQKITETSPSISAWIAIADQFISFETAEVKYTAESR